MSIQELTQEEINQMLLDFESMVNNNDNKSFV